MQEHRHLSFRSWSLVIATTREAYLGRGIHEGPGCYLEERKRNQLSISRQIPHHYEIDGNAQSVDVRFNLLGIYGLQKLGYFEEVE